MSRRSKGASRGATLLEVLLGLALLGTVAVAMLVARGRLLDQQTRANKASIATQALDQQLAGWWAEEGVPREGSGELLLAEGRSLRWEAITLGAASDQALDSGQDLNLSRNDQPQLPGEVVRIEVYEEANAASDTIDARPLVAVELLLPEETPGETDDEFTAADAEGGGV